MEHQCALCNEDIDEQSLELGECIEVEGEYWHPECYAEYFDEAFETA